jgi:hypothetical protein
MKHRGVYRGPGATVKPCVYTAVAASHSAKPITLEDLRRVVTMLQPVIEADMAACLRHIPPVQDVYYESAKPHLIAVKDRASQSQFGLCAVPHIDGRTRLFYSMGCVKSDPVEIPWDWRAMMEDI